ncbi:MAG TPA: hypothetical protein VJB59_13985 [Bdellovibrionota bacterium]|nr:hypothetical protein [Bdellovibrionota bacterium]
MLQHLKFISLSLFIVIAAIGATVSIPAAQAGGDSSGGGSGVATFKAGQPHTSQNLLKVETLALFKARRAGQNLVLSPDPDIKQDELVQSSIEIEVARWMQKVHAEFERIAPEFHALFLLADEKFIEQQLQTRDIYETSKTTTPNAAPLSLELDILNDFGDRPDLSPDQEFVQIVKRTSPVFHINQALWTKMSVEDRVDLRIHEAAYAISRHPDSTRIQKFEIYLLSAIAEGRPLDPAEFKRLASSEWNLAAAEGTLLTQAIQVPGAKKTEIQPYSSNSLIPEAIPDGIPTGPASGYESLQCGIVSDFNSSDPKAAFHFLYWNGKNGKKIEKSFSADEHKMVATLQEASRRYLDAQINPLVHPFTLNYPDVFCFKKGLLGIGLGKLRFVEFRKAYNAKTAQRKIEEIRSNLAGSLAGLIYERIQAEYDHFFENGGPQLSVHDLARLASAKRHELAPLFDLLRSESAVLALSTELTYWIELKSAYSRRCDYLDDLGERSGCRVELMQAEMELYKLESEILAMRAERSTIEPPNVIYIPGPRGRIGQLVEKADPYVILDRLAFEIGR